MEFFEAGGARIACFAAGDPAAEPVVLLHGYMGSHHTWRHQIAPLARRHRVVAVDWPGGGRSSRNPALRYDYDTETARLGSLLDALEIRECNLFGPDCASCIPAREILRSRG
ncbi:MAG: alpha/beta fold hydrolase, partial [Myxococcota bacterium]